MFPMQQENPMGGIPAGLYTILRGQVGSVCLSYCRVPARWRLQQTHPGLRAATRHGVRDNYLYNILAGPMVLSNIDECLSNVDEPKMFTV